MVFLVLETWSGMMPILLLPQTSSASKSNISRSQNNQFWRSSNCQYYWVSIFATLKPVSKIFKRKVLQKVLPRLLIKSYAFDLEIISVANHLGFTKIYEAPIKLNYDFDSLTHAQGLKIIYQSLIDALAVFYRLRILHYYDDKNNRKWVYDPELSMRINTGQ